MCCLVTFFPFTPSVLSPSPSLSLSLSLSFPLSPFSFPQIREKKGSGQKMRGLRPRPAHLPRRVQLEATRFGLHNHGA